MIEDWNSVEDSLPKHDQRVLGYIPGNKVFLPGKSLAFEVRRWSFCVFAKIFTCTMLKKHPSMACTFGRARATATTTSQT